MDIIERYLGAVRWNLPSSEKADDIIAELRDLIASRIEEREEALDRPLTKEEISKLLQGFGHPLVVAAGYGKQHALIGPDLFPFYFFSLKIVLGISVLILVVSGLANILFEQQDVIRTASRAFNGAFWTLLSHAGLVTLIFAVIERTGWLKDQLNRWSPEQLPDLSDLKFKPKKLFESAFEIACGVAFLLWWTGVIHFPSFYSNVRGLQIEPGPVWMHYYWPILTMASATLVMNVIQLVRPRWRSVHAGLQVAISVVGVAMLSLIYRSGEWVTVAGLGTMAPEKAAAIEKSLNLSLSITFSVVGVIWVLQALGALWRFYRAR
jgi:hypothetical protein